MDQFLVNLLGAQLNCLDERLFHESLCLKRHFFHFFLFLLGCCRKGFFYNIISLFLRTCYNLLRTLLALGLTFVDDRYGLRFSFANFFALDLFSLRDTLGGLFTATHTKLYLLASLRNDPHQGPVYSKRQHSQKNHKVGSLNKKSFEIYSKCAE